MLWLCSGRLTLADNVIGLGEGGLVECSILAECFCPLLPSPCYKLAGLVKTNVQSKHKTKKINKKAKGWK